MAPFNWNSGAIDLSDADIVLDIKFREDAGSVARVFEIAADLIKAMEDLDRALVGSVDHEIRTELILEDVEKSSLKVVLRNVLKHLDDDALKKLDWKPLVGQYLVKAKHIALQWLDRDEPEDTRQFYDLTEAMRQLAEATDVKHLPDYPPIKFSRLAQPLDAIQRVKSKFKEGEALVVTLDSHEYRVDLSQQWIPSEHLPPEDEQELANENDMVLVIKKPDFLGNSQWSFRHGPQAISASITDEAWLGDFRAGKHPLKPGDALRVRARFEHRYSKRGDLLDQTVTVTRVYSVLETDLPGRTLFED